MSALPAAAPADVRADARTTERGREVQYRYYANEESFVADQAYVGTDRRRLEGCIAVIDGLEPGEEVFAIRGKDTLALAMLNLYRELSYGTLETAKAEELERVIERAIAWRQGNRPLLHDPT